METRCVVFMAVKIYGVTSQWATVLYC